MPTILIADDLAIFREPLAEVLRARGYDVVCAKHGREVLGLVRSSPPDVILLDVSMPVMDGLEYLDAVAKDPSSPRPPVILLTDTADRSAVVRAARLGAREYVLKSQFSLPDLLTRIERCLGAGSPVGRDTSATPAPLSPAAPPAGRARLRPWEPLMTREQVERKLGDCGELKAFSPAVSRVLKLTQSEDSSIHSIADAIKQDHAMAVRILKLANSAVYTRSEPAHTVEKAVVRIGLSQIRQAMLNMSIIDCYSAQSVGGTDPAQFWEHALACGIIAAEVAHACCPDDADLAFTMGLLHDIGRVFYAEAFSDDYDRAVDAASDLRLPLEQVESRLLGLDHAEAGARLLQAWKFPRDLTDPIGMHHAAPDAIRRAAPGQVTRTAVLALADALAHAMVLGSSGNEVLYSTEPWCEALGLDGAVVARVEEIAARETEDLRLALLAETPGRGWTSRRERCREALQGPLRPLYSAAQPALDGYAIFCRRLADPGDGPPNVGVIHLRGAGEAGAVARRYLAAEADAGVAALPLIVLSPGGGLRPESPDLAGRWMESLPTPVPVAQWIDAVNRALGGQHAAAAA